MKGQINLEFLAAALIFLGSLGVLISFGNNALPGFDGSADEASLNLNAERLTSQILSASGSHSYGDGGSHWEKNSSTIDNTDAFGLAEDFLRVNRSKVEALRTADPRSGANYLNYTQFKEVTEAENQYRFNFTWMPIIRTSGSFERCNPPSDPDITEPENCFAGDGFSYYEKADNTVHYGSKTFGDTEYHFLVTSHDGIYNTTYVSRNWNFRFEEIRGTGNTLGTGRKLTIKRFQNLPQEPGSMFIVQKHIKTFGANVDSDSRVINFQRYAVMDGEPLRMEVLAW